MTNQEIVNQILAYHKQCGGSQYDLWYVGIASNPETRLFNDHGVNKEYGNWIYGPANSEKDARIVESHLLNRYDFDGDSGGGDETTRYVYAYQKTSVTRQ